MESGVRNQTDRGYETEEQGERVGRRWWNWGCFLGFWLRELSCDIFGKQIRIRGELESKSKLRKEINRDPTNRCKKSGAHSDWPQLCTDRSGSYRPLSLQMVPCIDPTHEWKTRQETARGKSHSSSLLKIAYASTFVNRFMRQRSEELFLKLQCLWIQPFPLEQICSGSATV